jgi:hypothetical protein
VYCSPTVASINCVLKQPIINKFNRQYNRLSQLQYFTSKRRTLIKSVGPYINKGRRGGNSGAY